MKIQCSCGAKYAFDVTADMVSNPVKFICQSCGADNSAGINAIIQQQFGAAAAAAPAPPPVALAPAIDSAPAAPAPPVAGGGTRLKVSVAHSAEAAQAGSAPRVEARSGVPCGKHPGHMAAEHCVVCHKPICPKCMELFGYVCSPLCKSEAEARRISVPAYAHQAAAVHAAGWRHFRLVTWGIAAALAAVIGLWIWYSASLSKPRVVFAVRFDEAAETGNARFIGKDVAIVLRGGRLIRYDLNGRKELWHSDLIDKQAIAANAAKVAAARKTAYEEYKQQRLMNGGSENELRKFAPPSEAEVAADMERRAADAMQLHVREKNVWVSTPEKVVRFDIDTGKAAQEIALPKGYGSRAAMDEDTLVSFSTEESGREVATRINLTSGQTETQELRPAPAVAQVPAKTNRLAATAGKRPSIKAPPALAGAPRPAGASLAQFKTRRDPSLAEQIAAPAIVANQVRNTQLEDAMAEDKASGDLFDPVRGRIVMAGGKFIQLSARAVEKRIVERQAMKAPPKKSALDGEVTQSATLALANEMANESVRERTGGVIREDMSRYEVTLKRLGADSADWVGEVVGPPDFFALQTVNVLVAGKTLLVFDQSNRRLWESQLGFGVGQVEDVDDEFFGAGANAPAVEHGKDLYFRDEGMLTCFDLATGNVRWRLPSVGVKHVLFDDKGMLYAETTSASAEKLKYALQVDVGRKVHPLIIKVDPANGKLLWVSENNGKLAHVAGNLVYTLEWQGGVETGEENPYGIPGAYVPPHVRIRRLSPKTGKVAWEHYQRRGPLDVRFNGNTIEVLFRKEFQVLKFMTLG